MANRPPVTLIATCVVIEAVLLGVLWSITPEHFSQLVSSPDTSSYADVAIALAQTGDLIASSRTLGYPLFLAAGYFVGGAEYGNHVIISLQLLLNLLFTLGCWALLARLSPSAPTAVPVALTLFFFWAGLGMALELLTDFLAAFFFGAFLFGLLFWRSRRLLFVSATSLALATLLRPTFTFVPLLIPIAGYLVGRCTSRVPWAHITGFVFASLAATGISTAYQYGQQGYLGPSPVLAVNIGRTLDVLSESGRSEDGGVGHFQQRISERAGKPYNAVSPSEEERYAVEFFLEEFKARPGAVLLQLSTTVIKYLMAPLDSATMKGRRLFTSSNGLPDKVRVIIGVLCLPVWLLAIWPPFGFSKEAWAYYWLVAILTTMILGLTAINPFQGERIRFPMLAFMLPIAAWNASTLWRRATGRRLVEL